MVERLAEFLWHQQYGVQKNNIPNVRILYKADGTDVRVIVIFDMEDERRFTQEQYQHILQQIEQAYYQKTYLTVSILSLICAKDVELVKSYCEENQYTHWIVNTLTNRLIIFENQPQSFAMIRNKLEELLIGPLHRVNQEYSDPVNMKHSSFETHYNERGYNGTSLKVWLERVPICTVVLIIINVIIFLIMEMKGYRAMGLDSPREIQFLLDWGATSYVNIVQDSEYYRLFTALFLHGGFDHLVNNMMVLGIVGYMLENNFGRVRFLIVYFVAGILANIGSVFYFHEIGENVVGLGASGAIFGIIGGFAYLVVRYRGKRFDVSAKRFLLFVLITVYSGFQAKGQVDNIAHIVGFFIGILVCGLLDTIRRNQRMR